MEGTKEVKLLKDKVATTATLLRFISLVGLFICIIYGGIIYDEIKSVIPFLIYTAIGTFCMLLFYSISVIIELLYKIFENTLTSPADSEE
jgi:hypothetical protein